MPFVDYLVMMVWVLVPLGSFVARRQYPQLFARWKWAWRGIVCGVIALPISMVLYSLFFLIPVVGIKPGLPGLLLIMWHLMPFGGSLFQNLWSYAGRCFSCDGGLINVEAHGILELRLRLLRRRAQCVFAP
jgi:hypothetical protein